MILIIILFILFVIFGYFHGIYNTFKQDVMWEYYHDRQFEENREWKSRGYLKTPWGIKYET